MKPSFGLVLVFAALSMAACDAQVEAGPPVYATNPPPPPPPAQQTEVVYEQEPPPPPAEVAETPPPAPGPDFVWVKGYHRWDGHAYVWTRGRYERRPHERAHWAPAHWEHRGRGRAWVEGKWE
ncbi:MAG TPA: hypothetical protein VGI39_24660 [Polyangiaceae bacterium]|jgi:hypothetical protein